MQLSYDESMDILDIKYIPSKRTSFTVPPGIYENGDINKTLEYLLPELVKLSTTNDDVLLRSNLNNNETLICTKKNLFSIQS